jgi:hypothetical protein
MRAAIQAAPGKAPEEAAIGHNGGHDGGHDARHDGDDGNAARCRLGAAGAAEDPWDTAWCAPVGLRPVGLRPVGLRPVGLRPVGLRPVGLRPVAGQLSLMPAESSSSSVRGSPWPPSFRPTLPRPDRGPDLTLRVTDHTENTAEPAAPTTAPTVRHRVAQHAMLSSEARIRTDSAGRCINRLANPLAQHTLQGYSI